VYRFILYLWAEQLFLRATAEGFARPSHHLIVCPVHLSVTLVICIKTVQARIMKSSLWAAARSLVYRDKILCTWCRNPHTRCRCGGSPRTRVSKRVPT